RHRAAPASIDASDPAVRVCAESTWTGRSAAPRRSARPRSGLDGRRYTRPSLRSAVERRLGEKRGRRFQNLVRAFEFEVFALEPLQLGAFVGRQASPLPRIALGLADPPAQRLGLTAN